MCAACRIALNETCDAPAGGSKCEFPKHLMSKVAGAVASDSTQVGFAVISRTGKCIGTNCLPRTELTRP